MGLAGFRLAGDVDEPLVLERLRQPPDALALQRTGQLAPFVSGRSSVPRRLGLGASTSERSY